MWAHSCAGEAQLAKVAEVYAHLRILQNDVEISFSHSCPNDRWEIQITLSHGRAFLTFIFSSSTLLHT